jgi:hypothetical protein
MRTTMAKKKNQDETRGRKAGPRRAAVGLRLPVELVEKLDELVRKTRRSRSTEVTIALEEHLARNGIDITPAAAD